MSASYSIYSERCFVNGALIPATIAVESGKIKAVHNGKVEGARDFGDAVIMPGVIDAHVHINEPGRTAWEGFDSGTKAAAAGGITTVVDMPLNSSPVTTDVSALKQKVTAAEGNMHVNVGLYGGLVPANVSELTGLADAGVLGVKCFLTHSGIDDFPDLPVSFLPEALNVLSGYSLPLLVHCEFSDDAASVPGDSRSYNRYLQSRPDEWETKAIEAVIASARSVSGRAHIVHVSSERSLPIIRKGKDEGVAVTAETCPHYIFFNAEDIPDGNTVFKCAPPIRNRRNNEALRAAFRNGTLDFIASDHSPAPPEIKEVETGDLARAWGGIAGLQFLLSASSTALEKEMPLREFIPLLTEKPARFLQIDDRKGYLKAGCDADICIWQPEESFMVTEDRIFHRHKASPYIGTTLIGNVRCTIVNGEIVFSDNKFYKLNAGKWVLRK